MAALLREDGFSAAVREGTELDAVYREAGFRVGVHIADDGELDPARFVRGVALNAVERGVAFGKLGKELVQFQEQAFTNEIQRMIPSKKYLKFF